MNLLDVADRIGLKHIKKDGDNVIGIKNGGLPTIVTEDGSIKLLKGNVLPSLVYDKDANRTFVRPKGTNYSGKNAIIWLILSTVVSNDIKCKKMRKTLTDIVTPMVHDKNADKYIYNIVSHVIRTGEKAGIFTCDEYGDLLVDTKDIIKIFFGENTKEEKSEVVKEYNFNILAVDDLVSMIKNNKFLYIKTDNRVEVIKTEDMQVIAYPDEYIAYNGEPFIGEVYVTAEEAFK